MSLQTVNRETEESLIIGLDKRMKSESQFDVAKECEKLSKASLVNWPLIYPMIDRANEHIDSNPDLALRELQRVENFVALLETNGVGYRSAKKTDGIQSNPNNGSETQAYRPEGEKVQEHTRTKPSGVIETDWAW